MAVRKSRRVYAGYYNRYDGKLIYVVRVVTDIDTGEKIAICQYANYSDTGEYYTITKESFCERIEGNGKMVYRYSHRTQQKIDYQRLQIQEQNDMPEPKRRRAKPQLDEYDNRGYRRSKTYYAYAKDLCEHYLLDCRKHQLCVSKKEYLSSPPKCGCDVTSAVESMQVAKFTKYAGAFSVIMVVLTLKNGSITEAGIFDELMDKKGYFYSLFTVSQ